MDHMHNLKDDTQCVYTPDAGKVVGVVGCGVCGAEMDSERGREGYRGYASAMGRGEKSRFDYFECPHSKEKWHRQAVAIRSMAHKTPSARLATMLREEAAEIIATREATVDYWHGW